MAILVQGLTSNRRKRSVSVKSANIWKKCLQTNGPFPRGRSHIDHLITAITDRFDQPEYLVCYNLEVSIERQSWKSNSRRSKGHM